MEKYYGINYKRPKVFLFQESGLGVAEFAGRTAYDSFKNSEFACIKELDELISNNLIKEEEAKFSLLKNELNDLPESELLDKLAWAYHHHSVLEHINLSYLVKGTSRAVLQEHSRHRIQSITVRSTRYTLSSIINAFNATEKLFDFFSLVSSFDIFIVDDKRAKLDIEFMYKSLEYQFNELGSNEFLKISSSKEQQALLTNLDEGYSYQAVFNDLEKMKQKRNVGDAFKHIITDNLKVDMVVTFNLRSLKNFFDLRDSGAAYFQMRFLAEEMKKATPIKYLKLIDKKIKEEIENG